MWFPAAVYEPYSHNIWFQASKTLGMQHASSTLLVLVFSINTTYTNEQLYKCAHISQHGNFSSSILQVTHPLCDRNLIDARLDAVSEIMKSMSSSGASYDDIDWETSDIRIMQPEIHHILSSVLTVLSRSADVQRGITRIFHRTATASEVIEDLFTSVPNM